VTYPPGVRHKRIRVLQVVVSLLAVLFASTVRDASADASGNISVALLSERAAVEPGVPFYVGLRMTMRQGWHTYWKNPGDSGLPVRITWNLPEGFSAGPIEWPAPERLPEKALMSYGYGRDVLIPIEITPPKHLAADSVTIAGKVEWLECKDICLPGSSALRLSLPVRPGPPAVGPASRSFARARSRIPGAPKGWSFSAKAGPRAVSLAFRAPQGMFLRGGYLFVDQPLVVDYAAAQGFERIAGGYRLTIPPAPNASGTLERLTGVLVVEGRAGSKPRTAVQVDVPVSPGDTEPAPIPREQLRLPAVVAFAGAIGIVGLALALTARGILRRKSNHT
jgi:DsbC/DsbD-like thiol-disulfide interchange protein